MDYKNFLIVGAGSIGALKPDKYDSPKTKNILTHAHALYELRKQKKIDRFFIDDNDIKKEHKARNKWNADKYTHNADTLIICTNTNSHYQTIIDYIDQHTKLIICEKPFCNNYEEAKEIVELCKQKNIKLIVNYSRRFNPAFIDFKKTIKNQTIHSVMLKYGRGLKREASHFIDLCNFWFGNFINGRILNEYCIDFSDTDPTYSAHLQYEKCNNIFLCPVDSNDYGIFEIEILASNGRYIFKNNGKYLQYNSIMRDNIYGDYFILSDESIDFKINLENNLMNLYNWILNDKEIYSTGETALMVHEVYNKLGV